MHNFSVVRVIGPEKCRCWSVVMPASTAMSVAVSVAMPVRVSTLKGNSALKLDS